VNDRATDPKADLRATGPLPGAQVADTLLARALRRAWWTILWERLWPALASLCVAIGVFLAASWAGLWLWLRYGISGGWLHAKVALVVLLVAYHFWMGKLRRDFERDANTRSHVFYRWVNELPLVLLIAIVALVVVKPF